MKFLPIILILPLIGCESDRQAENYLRQNEVRLQCIEQGGIPLPAWWNSNELADCKFKPEQQLCPAS